MNQHKYGARATYVDGIRFDSKAEASRYVELRALAKAGLIADLELQPRYPLYAWSKGSQVKVADYVGDFRYLQDGELVVEDVKGMKTPTYRWKKKMMLACHGIAVRETT